MGRIVGVLYAMGPVGAAPSAALVETYEAIARATAANVATVRAFGHEAEAHPKQHASPGDLDTPQPIAEPQPFLDDVTGLGDHAAALAAIDSLIDAGEPFSVVLFDIDDLGDYHARHGVGAADVALRAAAIVATSQLRGSADVYRVDNDRFVAPLAGAAARDALSATEHIRHALARTIGQHGLAPFTVSFGVVEAGSDTTAERVLLSATDALFNARARGHDRVVVGIDVGSGTV